MRGIGVRGRGGRAGVPAVRVCQRRAWGSAAAAVCRRRRAAAPHRWSARLHACPASNEGARHVVIRLCFGGRGRGGRIAHARCDAARGRNSQLLARSTLKHAGSSRVRAPQRSRGEAASAPELGTPPMPRTPMPRTPRGHARHGHARCSYVLLSWHCESPSSLAAYIHVLHGAEQCDRAQSRTLRGESCCYCVPCNLVGLNTVISSDLRVHSS